MSTSNFADINTPADLARANEVERVEEVSPADKLMDLIISEDPGVGLEVVRRTLYALRDLHQHGANTYKEEGNTEAACIWYADTVVLARAIDLIDDITL